MEWKREWDGVEEEMDEGVGWGWIGVGDEWKREWEMEQEMEVEWQMQWETPHHLTLHLPIGYKFE